MGYTCINMSIKQLLIGHPPVMLHERGRKLHKNVIFFIFFEVCSERLTVLVVRISQAIFLSERIECLFTIFVLLLLLLYVFTGIIENCVKNHRFETSARVHYNIIYERKTKFSDVCHSSFEKSVGFFFFLIFLNLLLEK